MATTAFKRMPVYSKIMALLDVGILLSILNAFAYGFADSLETNSLIARFIGVIVGFIPGAPLWLFAHSIFNYALKYSAEISLKKKQTAGYYQISMAHFYGFFLGIFWKDLMWENKNNKFLLGLEFIDLGFKEMDNPSDDYFDFHFEDFECFIRS